ncbi:MAG: GDSL-type esterase/lipase family protein [Chloroflexi bacterium]|nr:GDSL-type esterase/lipase family protein [Chloroflexota bacterium]MCC6894966.1 SGNH/GDSL hydrolase family protein [Anaerolineae bacterium]
MRRFNKTLMVFLILVLLLVGVLVAAFVTFTFARMFYANENAVRLQPLGLSNYPFDPVPKTPGLKRVVFFGDSRAESWTPPENVTGYEFINRGIGGQTTAQILGRLPYHLAPLEPDVVLLQLGVNDLRTVAMFPDSRGSLITDALANIQAVIQQSTDLGATVILTTIFPVSEPTIERRIFFWSDDIARATEEANAVLRGFAAENVLIYDTDTVLLDSAGRVRVDYMPDTLHLNAAGYDALNVGLAEMLNDLNE